jgi:hypothetical protein
VKDLSDELARPETEAQGEFSEGERETPDGLLLDAGHALDRALGVALHERRENTKLLLVGQDVTHRAPAPATVYRAPCRALSASPLTRRIYHEAGGNRGESTDRSDTECPSDVRDRGARVGR